VIGSYPVDGELRQRHHQRSDVGVASELAWQRQRQRLNAPPVGQRQRQLTTTH
jgi:hypothetical protein